MNKDNFFKFVFYIIRMTFSELNLLCWSTQHGHFRTEKVQVTCCVTLAILCRKAKIISHKIDYILFLLFIISYLMYI